MTEMLGPSLAGYSADRSGVAPGHAMEGKILYFEKNDKRESRDFTSRDSVVPFWKDVR
jgi:hypothetical protein